MIKSSVFNLPPPVGVETNIHELSTIRKMAYAAKLHNEANAKEAQGFILPSFIRSSTFHDMYMHLLVNKVKTEDRCRARLLNDVMFSQNNYN